MERFERWYAYIGYCLESPIGAPVCRDFWVWVMFASFTLAALITIVAGWQIISHKLKHCAEAKRDVLSEQARMKQHREAGGRISAPDASDIRPH